MPPMDPHRMDPTRRPPVIDMTPEGDFRDAPGGPFGAQAGARFGPRFGADPLGAVPPGADPARRPSMLDRALGKLTGIALLVALVAGGLVLAALAVLFVSLALPVLIVAGTVGAVSIWWRLRRMRQQGRPVSFVVLRR